MFSIVSKCNYKNDLQITVSYDTPKQLHQEMLKLKQEIYPSLVLNKILATTTPYECIVIVKDYNIEEEPKKEKLFNIEDLF